MSNMSNEEWDVVQWKIEGKCLCCGKDVEHDGHKWLCWYSLCVAGWATLKDIDKKRNNAIFGPRWYAADSMQKRLEVFVSDEAIIEANREIAIATMEEKASSSWKYGYLGRCGSL